MASVARGDSKIYGKNLVSQTARNPLAWAVYRLCGRVSESLGRVYGHARFARESGERDENLRRLTHELFPQDLTVEAGPFKGLHYPSAQSFGSALLPKLLGSYESELHPLIGAMLLNDYTSVVDIGCAEGYYAVGLGLKFPQAQIYAFDTDTRAQRLCVELAKINRVDQRLHLDSFCSDATLKSIALGRKALVISDCEGYEHRLFTEEVALHLAPHDLIVETHDFIDIEISSRLRETFAKTHQIRSVKSVDDIEKALTYRYPHLDRYDLKTRRLILGERRPAIMEWLVMTARPTEPIEGAENRNSIQNVM